MYSSTYGLRVIQILLSFDSPSKTVKYGIKQKLHEIFM
jgi:hypothetical protein